jgi:zinc protease
LNGIIPYPATTTTLANGLKIIVMPMPSDDLVAFWTIVRTGSRDEYEPGRTGFAHFFEHMMFRGTERYPAERYQRVMTAIGADANAYTTDDYTAYHESFAAEDLDQVMELESDRFEHLAYSESAFQTEAGAVYGEYRKSRTDPMFSLYEKIAAAAFEKHPYGHTTMGYERDIAAMPQLYEYSRQFFARYYRPENTVLFVAGAVEPKRVLALAEKYYAGWQRGYVAPDIPQEPAQRAERRIGVSYDGQTLPIVWAAYKLPAFDPADRVRVAADLLVELAYGETSKAYRQLVLDEQSVEFLDASAGHNRDPGLLDVYARVKEPVKIDEVLKVIDETAAQYCNSAPGPERLAALKQRLRYSFLMGLQTPERTAAALARYVAIGGDLDGVQQLYAAYAAVTPGDVHAAAERYLRPEQRTVAVLQGRQ